ncbi:MAG: hypothetical protein E7468_03475 [Ruminococcaceae bacterium]|nr:hypothetical protein [Oscillospiraceae bacterium]
MKKLFAILLAVMMLASMATIASAANTTTLTTNVPAASYTLNVPADQEITYGATETKLGAVTVTNASGFAVGKSLKITITYDAFSSESVSTTIPFVVEARYADNNYQHNEKTIASGEYIVFPGQASGDVDDTPYYSQAAKQWLDSFYIMVNSADWGKALGGEYTATITFTAEVVAE